MAAGAVTATILSPAHAAAQYKQIRIYMDANAKFSGSGNPLNGVSGKLKVQSNWNSSISGQFSHIEMNDNAGSYVQLGVFQGKITYVRNYFYSDPCATAEQSFSAPEFMLVFKAPNYCTGVPEIAIPLGQFGSTGNYRGFGLRRNSDGTYYATLDGTKKYTTPAALPAAMVPNVGMDTNDTCASATHSAYDAANSGGATLALHDNVQGWRYWTSGAYFFRPDPLPSGYSYGRYTTAYNTHFAGGNSCS